MLPDPSVATVDAQTAAERLLRHLRESGYELAGSGAEICLHHHLIAGERGRLALGHDAASLHHIAVTTCSQAATCPREISKSELRTRGPRGQWISPEVCPPGTLSPVRMVPKPPIRSRSTPMEIGPSVDLPCLC